MAPNANRLLLALAWDSLAKAQAKRSSPSIELDTTSDYVWAFMKVVLSCSPIIIIVFMLCLAREDDETEAAKIEAAKNSKSCKT
mmetsp:Transcript_30625/g.45319  ORF Transcript_30625/g.45319 Transcript_30625/m.45319 type:complete len:84 (-) Transcript_30625:340-591(-)|eukprot:CAMPEP_0195520954 /NCGR_PEP_ID=MMETSP0794_2-20130614/17678_1 /TAXON_ID=515487 /ORGANISM="Stephanopyxis turris, Strain CCMP 815" /LENGTH=83 /DNA_ID=CAMNT_0040650401 /DNA_START=62 /DNA_END=313 /DNA_ORIENTATION=-